MTPSPRLAAVLAVLATAPAAAPAAEQEIALPAVEAGAARETGRSPVQGFAAGVSATGTKTDTPLIDTPQAITVIPATAWTR